MFNTDKLVGRKIVKACYMSKKEANDLMWSHPAIILHLDDGSILYPTSDEEGNDAGALNYQHKKDTDVF